MSAELPSEARQRLLADAHALAAPTGALLHGRDRRVRELGRGAMGVVYEAEDLALRRRVALERLRLPAGVGLLARAGRAEEERAARERARADLDRARELAPESERLRTIAARMEGAVPE